MFGIGGFELFLILLFGFLIFGPEKLPEIAKTAGKAIAKFRSAQEEMNGVLKGEVFDKDSDTPFKNPLDAIDNAAAKAQKASASARKTAAQVSEKAESFSERKARYDRERAARKAAEEEAAKAAAAGEAGAGEAGEAAKAAAGASAAGAASQAADKPRPTAAELYGTATKAAPKEDKPDAAAAEPAADAAAAEGKGE